MMRKAERGDAARGARSFGGEDSMQVIVGVF